MTAELDTRDRVQLHSAIGRLLYWVASISFVPSCASVVTVGWLAAQEGQFLPPIFMMIFYGAPALIISHWAIRHRGRIWATTAGLELGTPRRLVPWREISHVEYVPMLSALMPFYIIKYKDNRVPMHFYACDDVERVVARFKASDAASSAAGAHPLTAAQPL